MGALGNRGVVSAMCRILCEWGFPPPLLSKVFERRHCIDWWVIGVSSALLQLLVVLPFGRWQMIMTRS